MLVVSVTSALVGLFNTVAAEAQQAAKVARIGWLGDARTRSPYRREAFLQGMRDLGYVEGRNFVLESRYVEGALERFPDLAAGLVTLKVVFPAASDPVASGLVSSLARPGGNVTGLSFFSPELVGKCLELLMQRRRGSVGSLCSGSQANARKRTC